MESEYQHIVLVVEGDEQVGKTIDRLIRTEKINSVLADCGESGLEEIKKAQTPFSLIIADDTLSGMNGLRFLEEAKKITPDTGLFLMTTSPEMEILIHAVNKVSIQKFIAKPFEPDDLANAIRSGIERYDSFLDTHKLLLLAKKQNTELYDLNSDLLRATKNHNKTILGLDQDIETLQKEIKVFSSHAPVHPDILSGEIETHAKNDRGVDPEKLETLFSDTILALYNQFSDLAYRSGFELPEIGDDSP